jgi:protein phosphatase 2C family protein 2/3
MVSCSRDALPDIPDSRIGIWDCLTSQQCVDVVRLLISQGKDLSEVAEIVCELCLAPDTESGAGIGCDNMTMLVVALLNGKSKEEWKAWVTDRVKNHVGHATPETLPQLYSQARLAAFKAKRAAEDAREKDRQARLGDTNTSPPFGQTGLSSFARILGGPGGLSFRPGGPIMADSGALMFTEDETESDESDDMEDHGLFGRTYRNYDPTPNKSLKEQLEGLEEPAGGKNGDSSTRPQLNGKLGGANDIDLDDDQHGIAFEPRTAPLQKSETPPPPKPLPNGTTMEQEPHQLEALPGSDEAAPAVKAEGLMDTSEDPLVA